MPRLEDLKRYYQTLDWRFSDAAWSDRWGGTDVQWHGTILPRIHAFLPCDNALEIGPGRGRLSEYLRQYCNRLHLADIDAGAITACRSRFSGDSGVIATQIDGRGLAEINDRFDFVFSFFSLVHADAQTMSGLVRRLPALLKRSGVAFLHHSNAGACLSGNPEHDETLNAYRSTEVTADFIRDTAQEADMSCCGQELFGWDTAEQLTDCFSIITVPNSRWQHPYRAIRNVAFPDEVVRLKEFSTLYSRSARCL